MRKKAKNGNYQNGARVMLNVAEKPSIAKLVARFLSGGQSSKRTSKSKYNPIFEFDYNHHGEEVLMLVTSVTGHIQNIDFDPRFTSWALTDPLTLIKSAKILTKFSDDKIPVVKNLEHLAVQATDIVLWLDCDREGEAICYEVLEVCLPKNDSLEIHRAHFSAATRQDIQRAMKNLKKPDPNKRDAVQVRQEIDLRIGAAFTRL